MRRALHNQGDAVSTDARNAFAKIGVLMASASRSAQAMHPTNLHVNKALFPNDTVQSRLPEPGWLEHWLDTQIRFGPDWEQRVVTRILHILSKLLDSPFENVKDLNRYRKALLGRLAPQPERTESGILLSV
ncbi:Uncharacterised protein [Bordetella trematum]|nr:Uncharacterised protein [Bordetella trematum]